MEDAVMSTERNVLIIEDDRDFVDALRVMFESKNYTVRCAYDGQGGFDEIEKQKPDAIILDVMMTTLTEGFDVAFHLKTKEEFRDIPIVMVTGFPHEMAKMGSEKFQNILSEDWPAARILEKPVDPEKILAAVEALLK
jgi:DNA-binding response OmpR family regulator